MKRIFMVSSQLLFSLGVENLLRQQAGLEIVGRETDATKALERIRELKPDVVLMDLLMPKKDGFEVIKEVRSNAENKTLPIIVLSNLGGDEDIKKALELGANDYFVKTQHPMSEIVEKSKKYESRG